MSKNIMLVAVGTAGDVFPFVGLGGALAQRGNKVHLLSLSRYRAFAESAGLVFHEIPGVVGATGDANFYHPTLSIRLIAQKTLLPCVKPVLDHISRLDPHEWTIVADMVSYGVRIAQECREFRFTTGIVSPFMLPSIERMPVSPGFSLPGWSPASLKRLFFRFVSGLWDRELAPELNLIRQEVGLKPVKEIAFGWSLSRDRVIGLFPDWFAPRPSDWPAQFAHGCFTTHDLARNTVLPTALENPRDPLVVFCAGSAGIAATRFFSDAIAASRGRSWTAVLLAPEWKPEGDLPANVIHCGYIPLSTLLPRAAVVVHHGGLGAISAAIRAGVPQVAVPFGHDQYDNAERLKNLGVGRAITSKLTRGSQISSAVRALLVDFDVQKTCRSLAAKAASHSPLERLCERVEAEGSEIPGARVLVKMQAAGL